MHGGGPSGVVVLQALVVDVVDVAGGVLTLEIVQRPQQEVPLLLQGRVGVGVGRARLLHDRPRASATIARSASVTGAAFERRQRRKPMASPTAPSRITTTGSTQTSPVTPVAEGRSSISSPNRLRRKSLISLIGVAGLDPSGDVSADLLGDRRLGLGHGLAPTGRALGRLGDGEDAVLGRAGCAVGPGRHDQGHGQHERHQHP